MKQHKQSSISQQDNDSKRRAGEVNYDGSDSADTAPKSGLIKVLCLLAVTAVLFSYLGAYAVAGVLANADLIPKWSPAADPRPKWMLAGFILLVVVFSLIALVFRIVSRRNL